MFRNLEAEQARLRLTNQKVADVMEWYIYGSEARYKQLEAKGVEGQMGFPINQMYEDDSFGHPTCYQDWRDVADAKRICRKYVDRRM